MLGQLYYLNASLPPLSPEASPPIGRGEFFERCGLHLNEDEVLALRRCVVWEREIPGRGLAVWRHWLAFEHGLRGSLAALRARSMGWDVPRGQGAADAAVREAAEAAMAEENPLEAERALFGLRWRYLEERDRESFMTVDNLVVYFLRLQLLEEKSRWGAEEGRRALEDIRRVVETEWPGGETLAAGNGEA